MYRIVFEDGTTFNQPEQAKAPVYPYNAARQWRLITVTGEVEAVKAAFVDNAVYYQAWDSIVPVTDENGETQEVTQERRIPLSDFSIAGEVVDHRDGTCTVLMGKPTEIELLQAQIEAMPDYDMLAGEVRNGVNSIDE